MQLPPQAHVPSTTTQLHMTVPLADWPELQNPEELAMLLLRVVWMRLHVSCNSLDGGSVAMCGTECCLVLPAPSSAAAEVPAAAGLTST
jgi:hypothetical protein